MNDIHKRGGTILGTSRGGHDTTKIVDSIQDRGINQVYIIGGDGTQKGAAVIFEEIRRRGLKVAVAGIPKTIDNDIPVSKSCFPNDLKFLFIFYLCLFEIMKDCLFFLEYRLSIDRSVLTQL